MEYWNLHEKQLEAPDFFPHFGSRQEDHRVPRTGWFKQKPFIVSHFWSLGVCTQGAGKVGFFWRLWEEDLVQAFLCDLGIALCLYSFYACFWVHIFLFYKETSHIGSAPP